MAKTLRVKWLIKLVSAELAYATATDFHTASSLSFPVVSYYYCPFDIYS